jgi:hypothetical protein
MHVPRTHDAVYLDRCQNIFVVGSVDDETHVADLIPVGRGPTEEDIPWERLFAVAPDPHLPVQLDA